MLMCSLHHSPSDQVQNGRTFVKYIVFEPGLGPITQNYINYINFLFQLQLVIIFQINYNYTVSITLCRTKYIQHLLIMYFCAFCNILYTIDKQI